MDNGGNGILADTISTITMVAKLIVGVLIGSFKALLPSGVLPRKSVKNEVVLITGAASGLGRLMAIEFAKLGARLVLWDVDEAGNNETKVMVEELSASATTYKVDLTKKEEIYGVANRVKSEVGEVSILVNNAGIVSGKPLVECPDESIERTLRVNTLSVLYATKAFLPHMLETNHGHIVIISSMAGKVGLAGLVDYCTSKHGSVGFGTALTEEVRHCGKYGVRVTTVCPTVIDTGMFKGFTTGSPVLIPILSQEYVVSQIMEAVLTEKEVIYVPKSSYFFLFLMSFLPTECHHIISDYFKANEGMDAFIGRS